MLFNKPFSANRWQFRTFSAEPRKLRACSIAKTLPSPTSQHVLEKTSLAPSLPVSLPTLILQNCPYVSRPSRMIYLCPLRTASGGQSCHSVARRAYDAKIHSVINQHRHQLDLTVHAEKWTFAQLMRVYSKETRTGEGWFRWLKWWNAY